MDIYLSVNNRAEILRIPVLPPSFTISKPQSLTVFETVSQGELQLIGTPKLKGIAIESFFPAPNHDYPYLRNKDIWGWDYIYMIDTWIERKLPIRLVITDTPINMAVAVKNFEYTVKTDGDLWYRLELEEFNLLLPDNSQTATEEEIDMEELNKLKEQVDSHVTIAVVNNGGKKINIIARSVENVLNVKEFLEPYGGSGHIQAGSATLTDRNAQELLDEIEQRLHGAIPQMMKVSDIMTSPVIAVGVDARVDEGYRTMLRFGVKSLPVISSDGEVVGMMTRKDLDKAHLQIGRASCRERV